MIDRCKESDEVSLLDEAYAEVPNFSRIKRNANRSMPVSSHTRSKAGRRRFGKNHSFAENGSHRRRIQRPLYKSHDPTE